MACSWKITTQGLELLASQASFTSLDEASRALPGGVYTTLRTYKGGKAALDLEAHFHRLEESAEISGKPLLIDREQVRRAIRQALATFPLEGEARVRLTLDLEQRPGDLYLSLETLSQPLPSAYQQGVKAVTVRMERATPRAKQTAFIDRSSPVRRSLPPDVNEALMVDEAGYLREGLSSNFFGVQKETIYTAQEGVLMGTTRAIVLRGIAELGLRIIFEPVRIDKLPELDEAFITSASRSILPLRQIDEVTIGTGTPGTLTRRLMQWWEGYLEKALEII